MFDQKIEYLEKLYDRNLKHVERAKRFAGSDGTVTVHQLHRILSAVHCYYCYKQTKKGHRTLDHKTPLSRFGLHSASNLVMACPECNTRKACLTEQEFLTMRVFPQKHKVFLPKIEKIVCVQNRILKAVGT